MHKATCPHAYRAKIKSKETLGQSVNLALKLVDTLFG